MQEQEVIEAIKNMQKYQTETDKLEASLNFVRRNIGSMVIINNDGKRTDVPHYPILVKSHIKL